MSHTPFLPYRNKAFDLPKDLVAPAIPIEVWKILAAVGNPYTFFPMFGGLFSTPQIVQRVQEDVISFLEIDLDLNVSLYGADGNIVQATLSSPGIAVIMDAENNVTRTINLSFSTQGFQTRVTVPPGPGIETFNRKIKDVSPPGTLIPFRNFSEVATGNKYYIYGSCASTSGFAYRMVMPAGPFAGSFAPGELITGSTSGAIATVVFVDLLNNTLVLSNPIVNFVNPAIPLNTMFQVGETITGNGAGSGVMTNFIFPIVHNLANCNVKARGGFTTNPL